MNRGDAGFADPEAIRSATSTLLFGGRDRPAGKR